MKNKSKVVVAFIVGLLLSVSFVVIGGLDGIDYLGLKQGSRYGWLELETDGVLNLTTTRSGIGTMRPTGVTKTMILDFGNDTFGDQWAVARADTQIGLLFSADTIIDSVGMLSTWGSGDTVIVNSYHTDLSDTTVTLMSGPDTLISANAGYQNIDLTGVATATRSFDVSGLERPAFYLDEHGTVLLASFIIWYREYDATP